MFRIKRTKGTAVHWARQIDARGNVVQWTEQVAGAAPVNEAVAVKVLDTYKKRGSAAGKIEVVEVK